VAGRKLWKYDGTLASLVLDLGGTGGVWGVRPATGQIIKVDLHTGQALAAFPAPGNLLPTHTHIGLSIAEHGAALIYFDADDNPALLYRLNPLTGSVMSTESVPSSALLDGLSALSLTPNATGDVSLTGRNLSVGVNANGALLRSDGALGAVFLGL